MSKHLKSHWPLVEFLLYAKSPSQLQAALSTLSEEQLKALGEIALNVLYGVIPITRHHKNQLSSYSNKLDIIGNSSVSAKKRKSLITKNPAAILSLLTAARPVLKTLLQ